VGPAAAAAAVDWHHRHPLLPPRTSRRSWPSAGPAVVRRPWRGGAGPVVCNISDAGGCKPCGIRYKRFKGINWLRLQLSGKRQCHSSDGQTRQVAASEKKTPDAANRKPQTANHRPSTGGKSHCGRIAGYRIKPVRLGDTQLRQYCFYASSETRNQIRTSQTELNGVVLCPKLFSYCWVNGSR
jgi:hypothetical protein